MLAVSVHSGTHKSYQTTQRYVSMARQMDAAVASLHVPDVLRNASC